jgi:probable HAF family extracellular repeat protein
MTSRWTLAGLAMLLVATGPGGTITRADSGPYTIQDLGLPGLDSTALALNSDGVAVGFSSSDMGLSTAYRQMPGAGPEALPDVGAGNTAASGINDAGQVAMYGTTSSGFHAFRLDAGASTPTNLDPTTATALANGIDAGGRVVGYALLNSAFQAVRWNGSGTEVIAAGAGFSAAFGTSENGDVVVGSSGSDAFRWTTSAGYAALPSPGAVMAVARSANNAGDVVGYTHNGAALVGALWPAAGGGPLGLDGFEQGFDINAHGQVVGYGQSAAGERALLWQAGVTVDLNSLLEPGSGWVLTRAHAVNDAGQIVGEGIVGGLRRGFLLTPPALSDTTPPIISGVTTTPDSIWPPRHQMVSVSVGVSASDDSGETPECQVTGVTSSDPDNAGGDGDTSNDTEVTGPLSVSVRAERTGPVGARLYTVHVECRDGSGNAATSAGTVRVGELGAAQKKAARKSK